ncbi:Putative glycine cleavage system H protein, mitochondrial OS=Schizosaccharomyces pombe (strain 972 / ATCC 24843) GN=gcv3 PE=1 SV=1 [Rhizoctonia solani AG-1 IB]|uniref:Glycine cleavage system H protein n=1 Tax=Thanatephorus cucumeris (strain AG1-IB / isolate 7/3/14) TaxID=1108050 RepID=A0A0B7FPF5_THACB|nr:Putative glycine cleavage system H protein, mitochondrial OS=Schizosaccharomyces pombe (strain 972 / ATCC 24843) GN=gcv3 PE=1 SV=1 [Rhizoctonia solani AG-1 IB]
MFRSLYSTSVRAAALAQPRVVPRSTPLARTIVTKRYTKEHEWISYDSDTKLGTISITEYAQQQLGDVVFVELPKEGSQVKTGDQLGAVESVKAASDIYAPVSGTVKELNPALEQKPSLLNTAPESEGWLCKIELSDPSEIETLYTEEQYAKFCKEH